MDVIVDQPNILPAERRKRFAEFQRSGYYCQAMVVVPEESVRQDRATKRVASTGKVFLKISDFFIANFMIICNQFLENTRGAGEENEGKLLYAKS